MNQSFEACGHSESIYFLRAPTHNLLRENLVVSELSGRLTFLRVDLAHSHQHVEATLPISSKMFLLGHWRSEGGSILGGRVTVSGGRRGG